MANNTVTPKTSPEHAATATASADFLNALPKAELHLHLEGSITPSRLLALAAKNSVDLPYTDVASIERAYDFPDLQSFLDLYYLGAAVLRDETDFYAITRDYLDICRAENILHTEIMFDPQAHTSRGIAFDVIIRGISQALRDARVQWGHSSALIMSFMRHLSPEDAMQTITAAEPHGDLITAVGLDSSELGFPPELFTDVYDRARALGWRCVAHAGEEGPPEYVWGALNALKVERIDHGVRAEEDPALLAHLIETQTPLTVCPLSNVRLCVFNDLTDHNVLRLLDAGVMVTINSDDPPYFGGFLNENFRALADSLQLTKQQATRLAHNSFEASFLPAAARAQFAKLVDEYNQSDTTAHQSLS